MVSDTRPPPPRTRRIEVTGLDDCLEVFVEDVGRLACARGAHRWSRWIEQTFDSLEADGPIYRCACGATRKGIP